MHVSDLVICLGNGSILIKIAFENMAQTLALIKTRALNLVQFFSKCDQFQCFTHAMFAKF